MTFSEFIHTLTTMQMLALDADAEILVDGKPLNNVGYHLDKDGNGIWDFTSEGGSHES